MVSLQFITHQTERYSYLESARMALEGGCKWIQLRMKEAPLEEVEAVALQLKPLCKEHEAILVLDDHVELARKLEVDGVHLGKRICLSTRPAKFLERLSLSAALQIHSKMLYSTIVPVPITLASVLSGLLPLKEFKPCTGIGRLFLHPFTDERGEYRNPRSSDWRNHL